ncbi:MAG: nuclear transport factor 2 family protein [Saprospiraceae bacterium]|nr:nuclear transport factor 2 family protein [Saprospiraceae bacterium]
MKNTFFRLIILLILLTACNHSNLDNPSNSKQEKKPASRILDKEEQVIFTLLKEKDNILFKLGFEQCDTNSLRKIISTDLEFYHDQGGMMNSGTQFLQSIAGLCQMNYKATRELEENSLAIHLLKNNGELYGAIQTGKHRFYGEEGKSKYLTSTAEFTHLWILEANEWKLKRVLSFNHQAADQ